MTLLAILGMIAALAFGIYWGMPTSYRPDFDEIDEALGDENRARYQVERKTTFLTLLQRNMTRGSQRRRGRQQRQAFRFEPRSEAPTSRGGSGDAPGSSQGAPSGAPR